MLCYLVRERKEKMKRGFLGGFSHEIWQKRKLFPFCGQCGTYLMLWKYLFQTEYWSGKKK